MQVIALCGLPEHCNLAPKTFDTLVYLQPHVINLLSRAKMEFEQQLPQTLRLSSQESAHRPFSLQTFCFAVSSEKSTKQHSCASLLLGWNSQRSHFAICSGATRMEDCSSSAAGRFVTAAAR